MVAGYVPDRGDAVWLHFDPQSGHEQRGRRPALVLSPASYNGKVGLAILCPVTSRAKGYPFEVARPEQVLEFCHERDFDLKRLVTAGGRLGCNRVVFEKRQTAEHQLYNLYRRAS